MPRKKKLPENELNDSTKSTKYDFDSNGCNDTGTVRNDYYVYGHYRLDTGEIFYVGKGTRRRAYRDYHRNTHWHNVVNKVAYEVRILRDQLTDEESKCIEQELILQHGRRDIGTGCLVNHTNGGDGIDGFTHSSTSRQKMRQYWAKPESRTRASKGAIKRFQDPQERKKHSARMTHKSNCKEWGVIVDPTGKIHPPFKNLRQFCREHDLHSAHMQNVYNGKYNQHKGWHLPSSAETT